MDSSTYIVVGDIHNSYANLPHIPGLAEANGVIITGDLTNRGGPAQVRTVVEAVAGLTPKVYACIGNMDKPEAGDELVRLGVDIHRRLVSLAPGVTLLGLGWSTPTPFGTPSEVDDVTLGQWLEQTYTGLPPGQRLVLVSHTPPHGTACDRLHSGAHVGSRSVRAFIERVQPAVCLSGHIHESRATDHVGPTLVVNPGMLAEGGYAVLTVGATIEASLAMVRE